MLFYIKNIVSFTTSNNIPIPEILGTLLDSVNFILRFFSDEVANLQRKNLDLQKKLDLLMQSNQYNMVRQPKFQIVCVLKITSD